MSDVTEPDQDKTPDELLDWLCYMWATDGQRFYPPDETAQECCNALDTTDDWKQGVEYGQHARALDEALERFNDLHSLGFDPVARSQRHIEQIRERGLDVPDIDWSWLEVSNHPPEPPEDWNEQ